MTEVQDKLAGAYAGDLTFIEEECAAGTPFPRLASKLHARVSAGLFRSDKAILMGLAERYGYSLVQQPHMGLMRPVRMDLCSEMHGVLIQHVLAEHLHEDLDAVFEIGCGLGLDLVGLAARAPALAFYGGEIAPAARAAVDKLAAAAGLKNVTPVAFDIRAPDFSCVAGKDVVVYSNFALVYAKPFPRSFFPDLLDAVRSIRVILFEPVSFALGPLLQEAPLFTRERAKIYGISEDLWPVILDLQNSGRIAIEEVVPDISGRSAFSAVTLIRFRKAG